MVKIMEIKLDYGWWRKQGFNLFSGVKNVDYKRMYELSFLHELGGVGVRLYSCVIEVV